METLNAPTEGSKVAAMFVTVKYGDDQSRIFNANCRIDILLHYIRTLCKCDRKDIVDVSDERGVVKNLRNNPLDYATDYLKDRETLILLKVTRPSTSNKNADRTVYVPLLAELSDNAEFIEALHSLHEEDAMEVVNTPRGAAPPITRRQSSNQTNPPADSEAAKAKLKNGTARDSAKKQVPRRTGKTSAKK